MKKITLLAALFVAAVSAGAQTWTTYECNELPTAATPVWGTGDLGTTQPTYSINSGILDEITTDAADKATYKLNIAQPTTATVMIRTKQGTTASGIEFEINTTDGAATPKVYRIAFVYDGANGLKITRGDNKQSVAIGATTDFHTIRVTVTEGLKYNIYVDEVVTPVNSGNCEVTTNKQFLRFGDVGTTFTSGSIDWISWDVTTANLPGVVPAGVVVDKASSTGINDLTSSAVVSTEYFTITGVSAGASYDALAAGLYIQKSVKADGSVESVKIYKK